LYRFVEFFINQTARIIEVTKNHGLGGTAFHAERLVSGFDAMHTKRAGAGFAGRVLSVRRRFFFEGQLLIV
jgi:hypothetical protein